MSAVPSRLVELETRLREEGATTLLRSDDPPETADELLLRALALISLGQASPTRIRELGADLGAESSSTVALELFAKGTARGGDLSGATRALSEIVSLNPDDVLARLLYARFLLLARRRESAVEECEEAVRLAPSSCLARAYLAAAYHMSGRPADALRALHKEGRCPPFVLAQQTEMMAALTLHQWDRAISAYEARCSLLGKRSYPLLVRLWGRWGRFLAVALGLIAVAGIVLPHPVPFVVGLTGLIAFVPTARHILRSWRSTVPIIVEVLGLTLLFALAVAVR